MADDYSNIGSFVPLFVLSAASVLRCCYRCPISSSRPAEPRVECSWALSSGRPVAVENVIFQSQYKISITPRNPCDIGFITWTLLPLHPPILSHCRSVALGSVMIDDKAIEQVNEWVSERPLTCRVFQAIFSGCGWDTHSTELSNVCILVICQFHQVNEASSHFYWFRPFCGLDWIFTVTCNHHPNSGKHGNSVLYCRSSTPTSLLPPNQLLLIEIVRIWSTTQNELNTDPSTTTQRTAVDPSCHHGTAVVMLLTSRRLGWWLAGNSGLNYVVNGQRFSHVCPKLNLQQWASINI